MKMEVHQQLRLEQRMHLSQQMLQNLELLQLPIMELRELIVQELQENPTLEEKQDVEEPETPAPAPEAEAEEEEAEARQGEMFDSVEEQLFDSERRTRRSDPIEDAERRAEMLNNATPSGATLREHLTGQLMVLELTPDARSFCEYVIQNIDDNGYLKFSLDELVAGLPEELRREPAEVLSRKLEHAVSIIQAMEPRGVGARSIKECLLLQLDEADPYYPLLGRLIENHFEDVGANRLPKIVKALSADPEIMAFLGYTGEPDPNEVIEDVKALIGEISKLNPKPGSSYTRDRVPKVYPEVVIKQVEGKYEIVLEDGWLPAISLNRSYEEMLRERRLGKEDRERLSEMTKSDRFTEAERAVLSEAQKHRRVSKEEHDRLAEIGRSDRLTDAERKVLGAILEEGKLSREEHEFLKRKMDAGRKLITAIEQRRGTIYRITSEILKHQKEFFEHGIEHLRPLRMQEVADAVGIHLSTVSRAISEKWVETPRGIFPLKFFFASAAPKAAPSGPGLLPPAFGAEAQDEKTRLALMERIREVLDTEDRKNPLSDLEIVRRLKDLHGIVAARRTIAKYREEMGVPSSRLRKQY
jgi:RNA polymerase sigma-54 factor